MQEIAVLVEEFENTECQAEPGRVEYYKNETS